MDGPLHQHWYTIQRGKKDESIIREQTYCHALSAVPRMRRIAQTRFESGCAVSSPLQYDPSLMHPQARLLLGREGR